MDRRGFLRAATVLPAAGASGCGVDGILGGRNGVRVAVSWSAAELEAFRAVIDGLAPPAFGYRVETVPRGDDIDAALAARGAGRPDVVMLPRPGLVSETLAKAELQGKPPPLEPLPPGIWETNVTFPSYDWLWRKLLFYPGPDNGQPYALPFKAAHKSLVWYRKRAFREPPELSQLETWTNLALGAADGWVLTDFFENILLGVSRPAYDLLRSDGQRDWDTEDIRTAFDLLGRLWGAPGALAGGVERAMAMQFPDAVREVFAFERATLVVAPDYAEPFVDQAFPSKRAREREVGVVRFPALLPDHPDPLVAGGDVAVLTEPASEAAKDLVRRLASPSAPRPWIRQHGGFVPVHRETEVTFTEDLHPLLTRLQQNTTDFAFDLSDEIGGVGGRHGLWRVLRTFLVRVGNGRADRREQATDEAIRELQEYERERHAIEPETP